jgi:ferredoxin
MAKKVFVIDVGRCNGCYGCQIACKDEHVGNDWTPIAKPQPDTGQFWMKMTENVRGTIPKVKVHYMGIMCMHCDNAPCMKHARLKALFTREKMDWLSSILNSGPAARLRGCLPLRRFLLQMKICSLPRSVQVVPIFLITDGKNLDCVDILSHSSAKIHRRG